MITPSISTLHAMAGRYLHSTDLFAIDTDAHRRLTDLVRAFQRKALDPDGLRAALNSERIGAAAAAAPSAAAIAVIPLVGVLTPTPSIFSFLGFGTSVRTFTRDLMAATIDPTVKAIAIVADSPGGSVRLIPEAADAMRIARQRKPVVVSVAGMAASAAYWIASNATAIDATRSASVGAIGILAERISIARHLDDQGVDVHVVSAGKFKSEGHEAIPMTDAERTDLQRRVDKAYAGFVNDVAVGRHVSAATVRSGYGQGRLVEADDAVRVGLIDRLATTEQTIARAIAAPAAMTALMTTRAEQFRASTTRARSDDAAAEIAAHRRRVHGGAMR